LSISLKKDILFNMLFTKEVCMTIEENGTETQESKKEKNGTGADGAALL